MIIGSIEPVEYKRGKEKVSKLEKAEELSGKLARQSKENKLMHSVLENDKEIIEEGKLKLRGENKAPNEKLISELNTILDKLYKQLEQIRQKCTSSKLDKKELVKTA